MLGLFSSDSDPFFAQRVRLPQWPKRQVQTRAEQRQKAADILPVSSDLTRRLLPLKCGRTAERGQASGRHCNELGELPLGGFSAKRQPACVLAKAHTARGQHRFRGGVVAVRAYLSPQMESFGVRNGAVTGHQQRLGGHGRPVQAFNATSIAMSLCQPHCPLQLQVVRCRVLHGAEPTALSPTCTHRLPPQGVASACSTVDPRRLHCKKKSWRLSRSWWRLSSRLP